MFLGFIIVCGSLMFVNFWMLLTQKLSSPRICYRYTQSLLVWLPAKLLICFYEPIYFNNP